MLQNDQPGPQYHPAETKTVHGIVYSVLVPVNEPRFHVLIGEGAEPISEEVSCDDISPDNHIELFARGHEHAQKIIRSGDPRLKPLIEKLNEGATE